MQPAGMAQAFPPLKRQSVCGARAVPAGVSALTALRWKQTAAAFAAAILPTKTHVALQPETKREQGNERSGENEPEHGAPP